jgi:uncharacterized protein YjbJ (UPF0337 family)
MVSREKENVMGNEIRQGRWMQVRGRVKRAWGVLVGNDQVIADGNADVAEGALTESVGVAKREAVRTVNRGVDKLADFAKKTARSIER